MIVNAADLHLTPIVWKDMPSMKGDAYAALTQLVDKCIELRAACLLISGDIFDKAKLDSESVEVFRREMDRLHDNNVLVCVIQGQHEGAEPPWAQALGSAKYVGDGKPFTILNDGKDVTVVGFDYTNAIDLQAKLKQVKNVDILMLHQMAKQALDIEGAWNFDVDWVHKSVKLILAGDYHGHLNVGRLWYPGATHFRKIDEIGPKYCLTIDGDLKVTPVPLVTRPVLEVRAINDEQLDDAIKKIMDTELSTTLQEWQEISQPLVVARYSPDVKNVVPRIEEACQKREFLLRLKPLVGNTEDETHTELPQAATTLHECLDALVDRKEDEELHGFVAELLDAPEPRAVLEATKQRLGIGD